jgi:hypothetical protein
MKKTLRKLNLSRETLHTLEILPQAAGGGKTTTTVITGGSCECTWSCTCPVNCGTA